MEKKNCCRNCAFVKKEEGFFGDRYVCTFMEKNAVGNYVKVQEEGVCDGFMCKFDKENLGYKRSTNDSRCFLTSACVEYLGKADNCAELTVLRNFRDTYMQTTEKGRELVAEYYQVAPKIVEKIESMPKKNIYYEEIYKIIIICQQLILQNQYEEAQNTYCNMVRKLKLELL